MSNIVLIGYRGVGKSLISKLLSENNKCELLSLDTLLAERIGNLQEFVKSNGWETFRKEETKLLEELSNKQIKNKIIDCGGGVIEKEENFPLLKKLGKVFWLRANIETIKERLLGSNKRLSLSNKQSYLDEIKDVLKHRSPLYEKASDYIIDTDRKTPVLIIEEINSFK